MKAKLLSLLRPVLCVCIGLSLVFACSKINPIDGVELTVSTDIYKSPVLIQFVDGSSQSTKIPSGLTVKISGPGKDLVLDDLGGKDFNVSDDILTLVLDKTANPTEDKPVVFTISVSGNNYLSTSKTITIIDETPQKYIVPLVSITTPPSGVTTISQNIPLSGGTIQAPVGNGKAEAATITIASGTQVKDASGNVINTTSVSTQVVHFGSAQLESLLSFPGGFTPQNVNINGTNTAGSFVTAGFVAIDMQAGGKEVKSFTKPIEVKVGISDDFTNPDTNEKLKEGDTIPTWSYENSTGEWTREGEAKVTKDASGKLIATFTASHLSYWNLDYFYELGPKCGKYYTFVKTSSNVTSYQSGYHGYLYAGGQILNGGEFDVTNGAITYIRNPRRTSMQVKVFDMSKSPAPVVGQTSVFNPCTVETVPITLNLPAPPTPITVDVDFTAKCTNKQVNIKPSAWVTLLDPTAAWYSRYTGVYMYNGKATVTVKEGKEYVVSAWVAGKYYSGRATFGKTSSTLVTSGGTGLTGTTNYNTSTKRVKLVATYVTNSCK